MIKYFVALVAVSFLVSSCSSTQMQITGENVTISAAQFEAISRQLASSDGGSVEGDRVYIRSTPEGLEVTLIAAGEVASGHKLVGDPTGRGVSFVVAPDGRVVRMIRQR